MAQGRSLLGQIFRNFINSIKPRKYWGELIGKDSHGTEYYESPDIIRGRKPSRWFVPADKQNFNIEKPPEWESWLRYRRKEAPTEEEIQINLQNRLATIEKAKKLEKPKNTNEEMKVFDKPAFPVHEDYQLNPTQTQKTTDKQ